MEQYQRKAMRRAALYVVARRSIEMAREFGRVFMAFFIGCGMIVISVCAWAWAAKLGGFWPESH